MESEKKLPHVVIIGAGFGGMSAARVLKDAPVQVTLVDRNNYHLFQPLLYQVATSMLSPDEIAYPVRSIFRHQKNLNFHMGMVKEIDLANKRVVNEVSTIDYDYLVLAVGGQTNFFGIDSVEKNGFGMKRLEDATEIRNHVLHQFELAAKEEDPQVRKAMLTFVVVGGGPTGIEFAGAISELVRMVLHKEFPTLDFNDVKILLLEATDQLLLAMPKSFGEFTTAMLRKKHVHVRFKSAVSNYDGNTVALKDGEEIKARTLVWAAGVRAVSMLDKLGLPQDKLGRVEVAPTLQVPDHPEVFVIGDAASLEGQDGKPLPMVAPVAMQQGELVAKNVVHLLEGSSLSKFTYDDPGVLATIGRNEAVADLGRYQFKGFFAWLVWVVVHIYQLIGFRNRLAVLLDWAWNYIFYERSVRLIGPG